MSGLLLHELLAGVSDAVVRGDASIEIAEVRDDSRKVERGDLFVAKSVADDGRKFVAAAAARGAVAVVTDGEVDFPGVVVTVPNARRALGIIAANRHHAAENLSLMAITGTNGKTTTTYICESILRAAGRSPGVIGTVSYRVDGEERPAPLTTPGAIELHQLFADMRARGATDVVLEASSHALDQGRLEGCRFRVAALTNVTQDHLDYHGTMERYFEAKAILFERLLATSDGVGVFFVDTDEDRAMRLRTRGKTLGIALTGDADVSVRRRELRANGIEAEIATPAGTIGIRSSLVGEFNLRNIALAVAMSVARGISLAAIERGVAQLRGVPGRLQAVPNDRGVLCVVDYSHTPDALERAIAALRPLCRGRLLVVFGCGGDRDRTKRPIMGRTAARHADVSIVTSDNPRTETPKLIVSMILEGVHQEAIPELTADALAEARRGYHVSIDRRTAIQRAVAASRTGDVLLIAGKGHEDYQIVGTTKSHFDDREEAAQAFAQTGGTR